MKLTCTHGWARLVANRSEHYSRLQVSGTVTEHSEFPKVGVVSQYLRKYLLSLPRCAQNIYINKGHASVVRNFLPTDMNLASEPQQALQELQILLSFSLHRPSATSGQIFHVASGPRALDLPPQRYQRRAGTSHNKPSGPAAESSQNHLPDTVIAKGEMFVLSIPPGPEHWESEQTFEAIN